MVWTPKWHSKLSSDLCLYTKSPNPSKAIKLLVKQVMRESGQCEPPLDPFIIGKVMGVKEIRFGKIDGQAQLIPTRDGYVIELCQGGRQLFSAGPHNLSHAHRFYCFHEIAHIIIRDVREKLGLNNSTISSRAKVCVRDPRIEHLEEERLCDHAAAEFLVPTEIFVKVVPRLRPCRQSIETLSKTFGASPPTVRIKILDTGIWKINVITWKPIDPEFPHAGFIIKKCQSSHGTRNYLLGSKTLSNYMINGLANVYIGGNIVAENDLRIGPVRARMESVRSTDKGERCVDSILFIDG